MLAPTYLAPLLLAAVAEQPCSCGRVAALEADIASLKASIPALVKSAVADEMRAWRTTESSTAPTGPSLSRETIDASSRQHAAESRRLSTSSSTYVAVSTIHLHEFPDTTSCTPAPSGYMQFLPVKSSGGVTWEPSPSDVGDQMSLVKVGSDWNSTEMQTMAAPLKVVHTGNCTTAPTLHLPLNTAASGSFTVGGTLTVGTWQNIPISNGFQAIGGDPAFLVMNGLVFMRGGVYKSNNDNFGQGDKPLIMPTGASPSRVRTAVSADAHSGSLGGIKWWINADGNVECQTANVAPHGSFDGVVYSL